MTISLTKIRKIGHCHPNFIWQGVTHSDTRIPRSSDVTFKGSIFYSWIAKSAWDQFWFCFRHEIRLWHGLTPYFTSYFLQIRTPERYHVIPQASSEIWRVRCGDFDHFSREVKIESILFTPKMTINDFGQKYRKISPHEICHFFALSLRCDILLLPVIFLTATAMQICKSRHDTKNDPSISRIFVKSRINEMLLRLDRRSEKGLICQWRKKNISKLWKQRVVFPQQKLGTKMCV